MLQGDAIIKSYKVFHNKEAVVFQRKTVVVKMTQVANFFCVFIAN